MRKLFISLGCVLALAACTTSKSDKVADSRSSKSGQMAKAHNLQEAHTCERDKDIRQVWVSKRSEGGCEVKYEKWRETSTVAEAQWDRAYCARVSEKIVNNLEGAGYSCSVTTAERQAELREARN